MARRDEKTTEKTADGFELDSKAMQGAMQGMNVDVYSIKYMYKNKFLLFHIYTNIKYIYIFNMHGFNKYSLPHPARHGLGKMSKCRERG